MTKITIHCDGGSLGNPGRGYGSYEISGEGGVLAESFRVQFGDNLTNNQAEYLALLSALKGLHNLKAQVELEKVSLNIISDSRIMVCQLNGGWKCRTIHLQELREEALNLLSAFYEWQATWSSRTVSVDKFGH